VHSLLAPGIAAVFMAGIFSRSVTPKSGLIGLAVGFALGMVRLLMQATHQSAGVDWGALQWMVDLNWLYYSFLLFVFTCVVIFGVSRFTPPASPEQLAGLTYKTVSVDTAAEERRSYGFWEVFHTCVVAGIVIGIYIYFW
jgi:SSS family solute:Na+ symporter